ncbi:hypothetical protein N7478_000414 [Penicillium angulare]|uniref:uncharacterized protein n=1 Tax=Penicillium angulare TaxID=116970 RepID=UPI00253FAE84|nr:uncharacterized protein N7478_000414 [Penicillium angulare]KAJ5291163.1 hypothetical protein N7478_000414 [Penicillium angulare]
MISYAKQTRLNILPPELIYQLLDRLFNFQREDEENFDLVSLHTLQSLRQASPEFYEIVEEWMSDSAQKWIKFKEYELDFYRNRAHGFESNGKSFLAWAIEKNYQHCINWIIDQVPAESTFWKSGSGVGEEKHALRLLVDASNSVGFGRLCSKLVVAEVLENSDLYWMNSDDYKLKLCTFVTGDVANVLLSDHGMNIGDVGKYYLVSSESTDGEKPLRIDDDPRQVTTSWHEAANTTLTRTF